MIRINLIPPEYAERQDKNEQKFFLVFVSIVVVILMTSIFTIQKKKSLNLDAKIQQADTDLKKYQSIVDQINNIEQQKNKLISKRDVIRNLNSSRLIYPVFLEDLLPLIPPDVWVTDFKLDRQVGATMDYKLATNASSNFAVATLLTNLEQSSHFSMVKIDKIQYEYPQGQNKDSISVLHFQLSFSYQHKGPFPLSEFN